MATKTKKKAKAPKRGGTDQPDLIDVKHPAAKLLIPLAKEYVELRDQRMELGREEVDKRDKMLEVMKEHKLENFDSDGLHIEIVHEAEKVKVTRSKAEGAAAEDPK